VVGARLSIRVLGDFAASVDGAVVLDERFRRRKALALIKLLALQPTLSMPRDRLLDLLWPDIEPEAAANNLHKAVYYLRGAFADAGLAEPVELAGGVARLNAADVDIARFREAARRARGARINASLYASALALYGGELLPHDVYEPWTESAREDLTALHRRLVLDLARIHEISGDYALALQALRALDNRESDEEVQRAVIRAHALSGNREAALRAFARCETALRSELDVAPSEETWRLREHIASGAAPAARRAGRLPEAELVGREPEMARLLAALDETARGSGGIVLLGGEPGIGKTRLAEELAFHAQVAEMRVLWARCDPSESTPAYWPWIEALREFMPDGASEGAAGIGGLLPDGASRTISNSAGRFRLHDAIATFLRRASRERPVMLVLDDLHDADVASLQLLLHVARTAHDARLLIVSTFRDVDLTPEHALRSILGDLVREHLKAQITLRGLNPDEVAQFVHATAGVAPSDQLALALHRETEGNPFFVKECALMIGDASSARRAAAAFDVPLSVREAIIARVSSLTPQCREALSVAAVIGHHIEMAVLRRAAPLDGGALLDALDEATRRHILRDDGEAGEGYAFCHGLIRQTVYERTAAPRRIELHRVVGEAIEASDDPARHLAQLAYHFSEAAAAGSDRGKAIEYARRAGDADMAVFAWESARQHWEMARRLLEEDGDKAGLADILEKLPNLIFSSGQDLVRGIAYLERAVTLREQLGQPEQAAENHSRLGILLSTHFGDAARYAAVTDLTRALEHYQAAAPVLGAGPDRPSLAMFHVGLATVAFVGVHVAEGLAGSQTAMDVADRLGMRPVRATAQLLRAGVLKLGGRLREAEKLFEEAWRVADEMNDLAISFYAATNLADWTEGYAAGHGDLLKLELDRPRNAEATAQRTTLMHDIGNGLVRNGRLDEALAYGDQAPDSDLLQAWLRLYKGDWDDTLPAFRDGLNVIRQVGNRSAVANRSDHIAAIHLVRDEPEMAEIALEEELRIAIDGGSLLIELRARPELALIAAHCGDLSTAGLHLSRSEEILANGEPWGRKEGRAHIARAVTLAARGEAEAAESALRRSLDVFVARQLPWDEADAHVHLARAFARRGDDARALAHRTAALRVYAELKASRPWLERARR
jgi:DNA-binding SARP family transcriptional activator